MEMRRIQFSSFPRVRARFKCNSRNLGTHAQSLSPHWFKHGQVLNGDGVQAQSMLYSILQLPTRLRLLFGMKLKHEFVAAFFDVSFIAMVVFQIHKSILNWSK